MDREIGIQKLKEKLDVETGLVYCGDSMEIYEEILKSYTAEGTDKINRMETAFSEKDWKRYTVEVHSLKSTSLTIGAVELSEFAKRMEADAKAENNTSVTKNHQALLDMYKEVLTFIQSAL